MTSEHAAVQVPAESELGLVLRRAAAAGKPVIVDTGSERYELDVRPTPRPQTPAPTPPSPAQIARSLAGIRNASGGWKDLVDAAEFTAYIYARRRTANRPPVEL